jgi:hypothetical protein
MSTPPEDPRVQRNSDNTLDNNRNNNPDGNRGTDAPDTGPLNPPHFLGDDDDEEGDDDDNNPFPHGPPGGNPDDEDPEDDDGEDPEDPDEDMTMAQAMKFLAKAIRTTKEPGKSKVREPDTFDGSNSRKLRTFLVQCRLNFQDRPTTYPTEASKVVFALSYLAGTALAWFEPWLMLPDNAPKPAWWTSFNLFTKELQANFGPYDAEAEAESALENLIMRDNHRITKYVVEFNRLAADISWDDRALCRRFYKNLPARLKNEISRVGKPRSLADMRTLAQQMDYRHWEREEEIRQENATRKNPSSNNSGTNSGNSNSNSGKDKKKSSPYHKPSGSGNHQNSSTSSSFSAPNNNNPGKFNANKSSSSTSDISSKLGKDGKLTPEERKRCFDSKLCLFCGQSGHNAANCPKSTSNTSKTKARAVQVSSSDLSGLKK